VQLHESPIDLVVIIRWTPQ